MDLNEKLYSYLSELKLIDEESLDEVFELSKEGGGEFRELLLEKNLIDEPGLGKIIADILEVGFIKLSEQAISEEVLNIIPEVYARKNFVISFKKDKNGLHVATNNPTSQDVKVFISKKTGLECIFYYATRSDLLKALNLYSKNLERAFDEIIEHNVKEAKISKRAEPSIIKIVDTLLSYAERNKSSDIHIEPGKTGLKVRYRIDGILHDVITLPLQFLDQIVTRIKVLAKLRTDEHLAPQDGKIEHEVDGERIDIRVSVVPVTEGEKIVMRLLSEKTRNLSLTDLGFSTEDKSRLEKAYKRPYGMVLSTGPTGSGKTTTLYSILKILNRREINIMTIEDPVEYDIEGINQIQVNSKTNLTFASGLRSIVRQDPDIILVGEIRDEETADISINAALTGHLVLSTLHTNDAATTIPRLLDLGVEPFLVSSTVNAIVGQRLVRKLCVKCRHSSEVEVEHVVKLFSSTKDILVMIKRLFGESKKITVYSAKGCEVCHNTGYTERVGIFEVMIMEDAIKEAIVAKSDASEIKALAVKYGMKTMIEDGFEKVKSGATSLEEVLRVASD
jgi:type IV pilus assembly protein PilB